MSIAGNPGGRRVREGELPSPEVHLPRYPAAVSFSFCHAPVPTTLLNPPLTFGFSANFFIKKIQKHFIIIEKNGENAIRIAKGSH